MLKTTNAGPCHSGPAERDRPMKTIQSIELLEGYSRYDHLTSWIKAANDELSGRTMHPWNAEQAANKIRRGFDSPYNCASAIIRFTDGTIRRIY